MSKAVLPVMRAQGGGRIINVSSLLGLVPQPFMAAYVASKHAVEGFSGRWITRCANTVFGRRWSSPRTTSTAFDLNAAVADDPQPVYAPRRVVFDEVLGARKDGDAPTVVAKTIVAAATDPEAQARATPQAPERAGSARCAGSHPRGSSTGRSAS